MKIEQKIVVATITTEAADDPSRPEPQDVTGQLDDLSDGWRVVSVQPFSVSTATLPLSGLFWLF